MIRSLIVAAIAIAALSPTVVQAQLRPEMQTGSMIPSKPKELDKARAGEVRKGMARCIYRKAGRAADVMLGHSDNQVVDLAGAKIKSISSYLSLDDCLGDEVSGDQSALSLRMGSGFLRDLLAEEAYLARNRTVPVLPTPVPVLEAKYVSTGGMLARAQSMTAFTDCAVIKDVANADALLRTMPGSQKERAAATALAPVLGGCLRQGQQFALNATTIRALIAYAMWARFGQGPLQ